MGRDPLFWAGHALVLWITLRMLTSLAVSSGAQSLWALATALAATIVLSTVLLATLTRSTRLAAGRLALRLLPAPTVGAVLAGVTAGLNGASWQQVAVAGGAWVTGGLLAVLALLALGRRRTQTQGMSGFGS